jgi:hypothetical protein
MEYKDLEAIDSHKKTLARERLGNRIKVGAQQQELAIRRALDMVIVDRMWFPANMRFTVDGDDKVRVSYSTEVDKFYRLHTHALGQMASVIDVARVYVSKLRGGKRWRQDLLAHILNEHFTKEEFVTAKGKPISYLRRAVGDEIRGFQGRNFGRTLATAPLLKTFVEECARWKAGPIEGHTTDVATMLKCAMPYIFEPVKGEFVAFGVSFSNSDFGAGKLAVSGTVLRISSGTVAVTEDAMSRVHIGKLLGNDDEADLVLSDETIGKELDAHRSAVADMVKSVLAPANVNNALKMIQAADKHGIEWYRLRTALGKVLSKAEIEFVKQLLTNGDDLMDLPPVHQNGDERTATAWWAANVVGWFANKEEDAERKHALQSLAGEVLAA